MALEALNAGRPVVLDMESRLAKALVTFAKDLAGVVKERAERLRSGVLRPPRVAQRRNQDHDSKLTLMTPHAASATDIRDPQYQALKGRIHQDLLARLNLERLTQDVARGGGA